MRRKRDRSGAPAVREQTPVPRNPEEAVVRAEAVSYSIGSKTLIDDVAFELFPGTVTALIGPNGAGKSTMLGLLAGDIVPQRGEILVGGRAPGDWRPLELARERAVMLQQQTTNFGFSVEEAVAMGRLPYDVDEERDRAIVESALEESDVARLRRQDVTTLSGGEAARVAYARTVTQQTPIVLLDEPTAALDLQNQESLLRSTRRLADKGAAVIVVLHDLNQAARYADRVLMFSNGGLVADGPPQEVLSPERIEEVYGQKVLRMEHPQTGAPILIPVHD